MRNRMFIHKRVGAILLCLALLCGMICSTIVLPVSASAEEPKETYSVDFTDLAAMVDQAKYENSLYRPTVSDHAINEWASSRFAMFFNREGKTPIAQQKAYLGQGSFSLANDHNGEEGSAAGDSWGGEFIWNIHKDLGLYHQGSGGEIARKTDFLTLKTADGALAELTNMEITVDFYNVKQKGMVFVSLHEQTPGYYAFNGIAHTSDIIGAAYNGSGYGTLLVKTGDTSNKKGFNNSDLTTYASGTPELPDGGDVRLYVKSVGTTLTVKVTSIDGTVVYDDRVIKDAVSGQKGYVSVGVANSVRAIKRIEVKELDENGKQIDFGSSTEKVDAFSVDFAELAALVDASAFGTNGRYQSTIHDDAINEWVNDRFALVFNREDKTPLATQKNYLGQSSFTLRNDHNDGSAKENTQGDTWGSGLYWEIDKNGYLYHNTGTNHSGGEVARKGDALTLKAESGALAELTNMEIRVVFNTAANEKGMVYVSLHEETAGYYPYHTVNATSDIIGVAVDNNSQGIFSTYVGQTIDRHGHLGELPSMKNFDSNLAANTDYELYVKALGTTLFVRVTAVETDTVVYEEIRTDVLTARKGYVSVGTTRTDRALKSIEVKELDANGSPIAFGSNTEGVENFTFDVRNLIARNNGNYVATAGTSDANRSWFTFYDGAAHAETTDAGIVKAFLDDKFAFYYNNENIYGPVDAGQWKAYDGQTSDMAAYGQLYDGMWLQREYSSGYKENFRLISSMVPRGDNGEELVMKNFETSFSFYFDGYSTANNTKNDGSVIIGFCQQTPGKFVDKWYGLNKEQGFVCITRTGVTISAGEAITSGWGLDNNMYNKDLTWSYDDLTTSDVEYLDNSMYVTVKVVGSNCWVSLYKGDKNTLLWNNDGNPITVDYDKEGYISYGLASKKVSIADITLTRLDDQGNPIDIDNNRQVNTFEFSPENIIPYDAANHRYPAYVNSAQNNWYEFTGGTAMNAARAVKTLDEKFALYYNWDKFYTQMEAGEKTAFAWQDSKEYPKDVGASNYGWFAQLYDNKWLQRFVREQNGHENLRLISSLVPRSDKTGEELVLRNFETSFDVYFESATAHAGSAVLGFRQQTPGKFVDGYNVVNKEQAFVSVTYDGVTIAGGAKISDSAYNQDLTYKFADGVKGKAMNIKVKVVGTDCWITITRNDGTLMFDNGGKSLTVNYDYDGYIAYGLGSGQMSIGDISLTRLDDKGDPIDIDYVDTQEDTLIEDVVTDKEQFVFKADIGTYTADTATLDEQAEALAVLNNKFVHYFVHEDTFEITPFYGNAGGDDESGNWLLAGHSWLKRIDAKGTGERVRQVNALSPKDQNGMLVQTKNFIAEFAYRFDENNSNLLFGFRQKNPAAFINGTGKMNWEQALIAIDRDYISVKGGTDITAEEFYSEKNTYGVLANSFKSQLPQEIRVKVKAVGTAVQVVIYAIDGTEPLFADNFTVGYTASGYMAFGVATASGSFGDITVTRLDDSGAPVDITVKKYQDEAQDDGIIRFSTSFEKLAGLVETYEDTNYRPTNLDNSINNYIENRFSLYYDREGDLKDRAYLGQNSDELDGGDEWGGQSYWQINKNGWLSRETTKVGGEMLRKLDLLTLKAPNGSDATVENFRASFTVNTSNTLGAVLLSFRNADPNRVAIGNFKISQNQQIVLVGKGNNGSGVTIAGGSEIADAYVYRNVATPVSALNGVTEYRVNVQVIGNTCDVLITSLSGAIKYYETSVTTQRTGKGYITLAVANATRSIGEITVEELDANGDPIDFGSNTAEKVDTFAFSVANTAAYANGKYADSDLMWYEFTGHYGEAATAGSSALISKLNSTFGMYYNWDMYYAQVEAGVKEAFPGQTSDYAWFGQVFANQWLQRLYSNETGHQIMRMISSLVPRDSTTGEELKLKNFETTFEVDLEQEGYGWGTALVGFRQQTPGKFTSGYFQMPQEQAFVAISRYGITVAGGEDIFAGRATDENGNLTHSSAQGDMYNGHPTVTFGDMFDDPATADKVEILPRNVKVTVKVVGSDCWITISNLNGTQVLFDNNGEPFTVNYDETGYIAYGIAGGKGSFGSISLTRLNDNGDPIDINETGTFSECGWDTSVDRYVAVMGSAATDLNKEFNYYYTRLGNGVSKTSSEKVDVHWALNSDGILMRQNDLSANATADVTSIHWNPDALRDKIGNFDASFKLRLDEKQQGTFWVISGQTDKDNIGRLVATPGDEDYLTGQLAVGVAVGGDVTLALGDGSAVTLNGPASGTPTGTYTVRVRVANGKVAVYINGTLRATRAVDAAALNEGYLTYGYSGAKLGIGSVTVTKLDQNGIPVDMTTEYTAVEQLDGVMVDIGANAAALNLPTTVKVYKGTAEEESAVAWDVSTCDFTTEGQYTVVGYLEKTNGIRAAVTVQVGKFDPENTVLYSFDDAAQLEDFDTWYLPETASVNKPAIHVKNTDNDNWYISEGRLQFKNSSLYQSVEALREGVTLDGTLWQNPEEGNGASYRNNYGIAVLKTQKYENFILEVDYKSHYTWNIVGFGAQATSGEDIFATQENGGPNFRNEYHTSAGAFYWAYDHEKAATNIHAATAFLSPYSLNEEHHMRIIVSDKVAYMYLDDIATPLRVELPDTYEGGYIYFALNTGVSYFDNLKIVDLDKKAIELTELKGLEDGITVNREQGDMLSLPLSATLADVDGYEYTLPVTWSNDDYRSGKSGDYLFTAAVDIHNVTFESATQCTVHNVIGNAFDEDKTVKYYFDHPNDLLDFDAYYSEKGQDDYTWSANKGEMVKADAPTDLWTVSGGKVMTTYSGSGGNWYPYMVGHDVSTMILKDYNLVNYRVEMDYTHGTSNWWYTYLLTSVQDPAKFMSVLQIDEADRNGNPTETSLNYEAALSGGVYTHLEQEGFLNVQGATMTHARRQLTNILNTSGSDFSDLYDSKQKHHLSITVLDGIMLVQVDNSELCAITLDPMAYGGFVGFGAHGNGSTVSNFTLTALDEEMNEIPLDEAAKGFAEVAEEDTYTGWKPDDDDWVFDWDERYIKSFY